MIDRRVQGQPLEHILGWAQFFGLRVAVGPGVFVPRRRSEFLVQRAAPLTPLGALVLDLCCGSGALGLALRSTVGEIRLFASDIDAVAVECARRNLGPIGGEVYRGDLFESVPVALRGRVDILLANTPYVPTPDIDLMPPEARLHEPHATLDGGPDGLDVQRRVAAEAKNWLAPTGRLLAETSERQLPLALAIFRNAGLHASSESADDPEADAHIIIASRA